MLSRSFWGFGGLVRLHAYSIIQGRLLSRDRIGTRSLVPVGSRDSDDLGTELVPRSPEGSRDRRDDGLFCGSSQRLLSSFNYVAVSAAMHSSRRSRTPQGGEPTHLAGGRGQSDSMQASRRNEQQRFDEFLKLRGRKAWKSHCTVDDLCDNSMVDDYMVYLSEEYV